jgi:hypothetical protein
LASKEKGLPIEAASPANEEESLQNEGKSLAGEEHTLRLQDVVVTSKLAPLNFEDGFFHRKRSPVVCKGSRFACKPELGRGIVWTPIFGS